MAENKKVVVPQLTINDNLIGTTYAQFVVVTSTDIDITINFIYINPRDNTKGQVVSRVTLPRPVGEDLAKTIINVVKLHEERKKEKKDGTN